MNDRIILYLSTVGPTGHIPLLAGTLGSIEGILLSLIFNYNIPVKILIWLALLICAVILGGKAEKISGIKDAHCVVADELVGAFTATFFLPQGIWPWFTALLIFRLIDWTKPFPIRRIEKLSLGTGVVADDFVAGIYTLGLIWIIHFKIM